jgi:signal transduction histidine kinase
MADAPSDRFLEERAFPELAAALRARSKAIVREYEQTVDHLIPAADKLTRQQVRDSMPEVLEQIARALESTGPAAAWKLADVSAEHGITRFHQQYDVKQLISEFRLLRRIVSEEVTEQLQRELSLPEVLALATGLDLYLQQGVVGFVEFQRGQLRAASEAEAKYLSYLSHDLRNNLNAVTSCSRCCTAPAGCAGLQGGRRRHRVAPAKHRRHSAGMDRLLQAERLRTKAIQARFAPVKLHEVAQHVVRQHQSNAATKDIRLVISAPDEAVVETDGELLGVILQNLVGNAIKYMSKGRVDIGARPRDGEWEVFVADQGPGIPPEHRDRIFNAFSRGDTHGQSGVGLD